MAGFKNIRSLSTALVDDGKTWISTFRKAPPASATALGQWFDYSYASGNPIPNYYAASPLEATTLEPDKGIIVPRLSGSDKQFLHRLTVMQAASTDTSTNVDGQPLFLMDYLLYYPFVDMDDAGTDQLMDNTTTLPRYTDGVGVQMMVVAQSQTVAGGRFTITYVASDDVQYTTTSMFCGTAQPSGALVQAVTGVAGLVPFVPLNGGVAGVKRVVSANFSVANGGLCAIVLVRPLIRSMVYEGCRRTTTGTLESFGSAYETEAVSSMGGIVEIKDGAFLGFIGQGASGSVQSAPLVGTLETVWG